MSSSQPQSHARPRGEETVGFVGLGNMGWNMATHLRTSGYVVLGYDADERITDEFARMGHVASPKLAELASASIIWLMLPTGDVVREVLLGESGGPALPASRQGLLSHLRPGTLVIDTTSSPPHSTRALGGELNAQGIRMVDAGVSGGHRGAIAGELVFMIGGASRDIARASVLMRTMSSQLFVMGELGSGHTMKAINNAVSAACFAAACEGLILGERLGLNPGLLLDVLNVSTGRSDASERSLPKILDGTFRKSFSLGLFTKDVLIACQLAHGAGVASPVVDLVYTRMAGALAQLGGDVDHSAAYRIWRDEPRVESL